jgi:hypothetical protein
VQRSASPCDLQPPSYRNRPKSGWKDGAFAAGADTGSRGRTACAAWSTLVASQLWPVPRYVSLHVSGKALPGRPLYSPTLGAVKGDEWCEVV